MGKMRTGSQPGDGGYLNYKKKPNGKRVFITTLIGMLAIILAGVIVAFAVDKKNREKAVQDIMSGSEEKEAPADPMLIKSVEDVSKSTEMDPLKQAILLIGPRLMQQSQITPEIMVGLLENAFMASKENGGSFAGMRFETGEGETPVAITYGEIFAGSNAPYFSTDTKAVEDLISGYFGEAFELYGPMVAYPEILNDGTKVTEWGEGYTVSATGITDAEILSMQLVGNELIVKARMNGGDASVWLLNFKKNEDSVFGYSLTYGSIIPGSMGMTQVHATHEDCVVASEAALADVAKGALSSVNVPAGESDCAWERDYYYDENDNLICAFMHDATDGSADQRMVFVDEYMILWSVGAQQAMVSADPSGEKAVRKYYVSEAGGNSNFENWQKFVLLDYRSHRL